MSLTDLMLDVYNAGFDMSIKPNRRDRCVVLVLSKDGRQVAARFFEKDLHWLAVSPRGSSPEVENRVNDLIAGVLAKIDEEGGE